MKYLLFIGWLFIVQLTFAQPKDFFDQNFSDAWVQGGNLKQYEEHPAVVLTDIGFSHVKWNEVKGGFIHYKRLKRVKIFSELGLDKANFSIPFDEDDDVYNVKGVVYNLVEGQVKKTKFNKKNSFVEKNKDGTSYLKFALSDVVKGSIVEVYYEKNISSIFRISPWYFQAEIPVLYSKYRTQTLNHLRYKVSQKGSILPQHHKKKEEELYTTHEWEYKDVPPFVKEPNMKSLTDFISQVRFEISEIDIPGIFNYKISSNWHYFDKRMYESSFEKLNSFYFFKRDLNKFKESLTDSISNIDLARKFVLSKMKWNKRFDISGNKELRYIYKDGEGNSGAVNMLLCSVLRCLGEKAWPAILSTRKNGEIQKSSPLSRDFNYSVVAVEQGDKMLFIDATEEKLPFDVLPQRCLNDWFRVYKDKVGEWYTYKPKSSSSMNYYYLQLNNDGEVSGKVLQNENGYLRAERVDQYDNSKGNQFKESLLKGEEGAELTELVFKDDNQLNNQVKIEYNIFSDQLTELSDELLYFSAIPFQRNKEHPFKSKDRKYPVYLGYPMKKTSVYQIQLPKSYSIESLPKSVMYKLFNDKNFYILNLKQINGSIIQITRQISIEDVEVGIDKYKELQQFFDMIVEKEDEQIVLKKNNY